MKSSLKRNILSETLIGMTAIRTSNQRMKRIAHLKRRISDACFSCIFWPERGKDVSAIVLPTSRGESRTHRRVEVRPKVVALAEADLEVDRLGLDALVLENLEGVMIDV
jgi:hypothetical protein